ncbi:MAG: T9SS type A sorting domain-containing protein, partial [Muribaculaceae bacterium]|nr:T9SS type A sorting domain-containing protein [Muribaculaceae bacterium]
KFAKVCDLDFLGWKYFDVPLTVLEGENTYHVKGLKIIQTPSPMGQTGEIMIDNINLIGDDGVESVAADVADFSIYPNPASDYLIANAVVWIEDIELLNMNGAVVAKAQGNVLNVSEIPAGAYLARVNVAGKKVTQKVIIKH